MKLTLRTKDGSEKNFVAPFISGRMLRNTIAMMKSYNLNDLGPEDLDLFADHVVKLFGNQFTLDEFYDGIESTEMMPFIAKCLEGVVRKTEEATRPLQSPNVQ